MEDIKGFIFDIDDTIINFKEANNIALKNLYEKYKYELDIYNYEHFLKIYEHSKNKTINNKIFDNFTIIYYLKTMIEHLKKNNNLIISMSEYYDNEMSKHITLEKNVINFLDHLKKNEYKIAALSNASLTYVLKNLKNHDLINYFDIIVTGDELSIKKPNQLLFTYVLNKLNLKAQDAVMIGDNYNSDILPAIDLGIKHCYLYDKNNKYIPDKNNNFFLFNDYEKLLLDFS